MRKTFIFVFCLLLTVSMAFFASADGVSDRWPIFSALEDFCSSLDWGKEGIQANLMLRDQQYTAVLQQDQDMTEVSIEGLGRCQFTPDRVLLDYNGMVASVEYASILNEWLDTQMWEQGFRLFTEVCNSAQQKAVEYLILPFAETISADDGLSLHLNVDGIRFQENLYKFFQDMIQELIQEEDFVRFYEIVGLGLRQSFPELPAQAEDLPSFLDAQFSYPSRRYTLSQNWRLQADLHVNFSAGMIQEIFLNGTFFDRYHDDYPISFEYIQRETGPFIRADLHLPVGNGSFSYADGQFEMEIGQSYYAPAISATGNFEPDTGKISMEIHSGYSDDNTAYVNGQVREDGFDFSVSYYNDLITVSMIKGEKYLHAKVKSVPSSAKYTRLDYDLWIHEEPDHALSIKLTGTRLDGGARAQTSETYSLLFGPTRIAFSIQPNTDIRYEGSLHYEMKEKGLDWKLELLWNSGYIYNPTPYMIHLSSEDRNIQISFSYPYGDWKVEGSGVIRLDKDGIPQSATGSAVTSCYYDPAGAKYTAYLFYNPGKLNITYDQGIYRLERIMNEPTELIYQLSHNTTQLGQFKMLFEKQPQRDSITAVISQDENLLAGLEIMKVEKQPIVPIDLTQAIIINPEFLRTMILGQ